MLTDVRISDTVALAVPRPRPILRPAARDLGPRLASLRAAVDALAVPDVGAFCAEVVRLRHLGVGLVAVDGKTLALSAGDIEPLALPIRDVRLAAPALRRWLAGLPPEGLAAADLSN